MQIKDAVAVITGGASGLGLATAKALLDEGARVVILDLPSSNGEGVAKELGDRARFAPADVCDEEAVTKAFDLAETLGPVRIVVNCAGAWALKVAQAFGDDAPMSSIHPGMAASWTLPRLIGPARERRSPLARGRGGFVRSGIVRPRGRSRPAGPSGPASLRIPPSGFPAGS